MIKECEKCGSKVKGHGKTTLGDGEYFYPLFSCDCSNNPANYAEKIEETDIKINYKSTRIDQFFLENDFKVYNKELLKYYNDIDWIKKGESLLIFGNPGTQKTGQVTVICKKVYKCFFSVLYYRATELPYQRDIEKIKNVKLLVLDNFAKDDFENSRGAVFDLIDFRIHNYLSTILITNISDNKIAEIYDFALADRIKMFKKIPILGKSKRSTLNGKKVTT